MAGDTLPPIKTTPTLGNTSDSRRTAMDPFASHPLKTKVADVAPAMIDVTQSSVSTSK